MLGNLVLPGAGTFLARRRISGILQLLVSQTGFVLMVIWVISFVGEWVRTGSMPDGITPMLKLGVIGCGLFLLAWTWSVISSISILLDSRKGGL